MIISFVHPKGAEVSQPTWLAPTVPKEVSILPPEPVILLALDRSSMLHITASSRYHLLHGWPRWTLQTARPT